MVARGIGNRDGVKNVDNVYEELRQCCWRTQSEASRKRGKGLNYDPTHLTSRSVRRGQLVQFSFLWVVCIIFTLVRG